MRVASFRGSERNLGEPCRQRVGDRPSAVGKCEYATDRGAFLPRLDSHFARDFLDESVECRRARRGRRREQRGIHAVSLDIHHRSTR